MTNSLVGMHTAISQLEHGDALRRAYVAGMLDANSHFAALGDTVPYDLISESATRYVQAQRQPEAEPSPRRSPPEIIWRDWPTLSQPFRAVDVPADPDECGC